LRNSILKDLKWVRRTSVRYFISGHRKKIHFAGLSVLGIAVGFIAVIVIIGIMNGLQQGYLRDIIEIDSYHVRIYPEDSRFLTSIISDAAEFDQTAYVFPFYELQGVIRTPEGITEPCLIKGVPEDHYLKDSGLSSEALIISGSFNIPTIDELVIGRGLAAKSGLGTGASAELLFLGEGRTINLVPLEKDTIITGVFYSSYPEIDTLICYANIQLLEKILPRSTPAVGVKLKDIGKVDSFAETVRKIPGVDSVETWKDRSKSLYSALMLEKYSMMFILFLIFIVVSYNIKNSLERLIFLQKKDIGLLAAIGASKQSLVLTFALQGLYVSLLGTGTGIVLGLITANNINVLLSLIGTAYTAVSGMQSAFFSYNFPVTVVTSEVVIVAFSVIAVSLLASWLAVRKILRFEPVRILHYE